MFKDLSTVSKNKSSIFLSVLVLIVAGVGAQATGLLNTSSGGYLVCVNSTTKVVTHPGTSTCPKGNIKLILGAKGAVGSTGLTGAAGLSGKDGRDGLDGKTLWNGVKDPESSWGAPGDMFINATTKVLFGPKNLDGTWPLGVSIIGPTGATGATGLTGLQGPGGANGGSGAAGATGQAGSNGTNATLKITELSLCDGVDDGTVANEICKVGMTGPGGGLVFFVDYNDQFPSFCPLPGDCNYLEAAPESCEGSIRAWSSNVTTSVVGLNYWAARAVGRGQTNTTAIMAAVTANTIANAPAAAYADGLTCGSQTDWFLGSLGEMKLMYDNLQGLGGFAGSGSYWTSTETNVGTSFIENFSAGYEFASLKSLANYYVRPVRVF